MHFTLKLLRPLEIVLEKKAGVKQFGKAYTHIHAKTFESKLYGSQCFREAR